MRDGFDTEYAALRQSGAAGWGGALHERRKEAWTYMLRRLQACDLIPPAPSAVLELGSGNGMVASLLVKAGYLVTGVEVSSVAVRWANDLFDDAGLLADFHIGSVSNMPFLTDERFDLVVDGNCFHCLLSHDRSTCLSEVARVLKPGGTLVLSSMCGQPKQLDDLLFFEESSGVMHRPGQEPRLLLPVSSLLQELQEANFSVAWTHVEVNPWWDHLTAVARLVRS